MHSQLTIEECRNYPRLTKADVILAGVYKEDHYDHLLYVLDSPFKSPFKEKRSVELYQPHVQDHKGAVLFLHWYEPGEPATSNRFQFREEAAALAEKGIISLCVETLWSDLDFFYKRSQEDDWDNSVKEIVHIRRYIDFLSQNYNGSPDRFMLTGHDFGGMYGLAAASFDSRIQHLVIMAATPCFSDWYFYYPDYADELRQTYKDQMSSIDPVVSLSKFRGKSLLLQFGDEDFHVPLEKSRMLVEQAPRAGEGMEFMEHHEYKAGHGLNSDAKADRLNWIQNRLL